MAWGALAAGIGVLGSILGSKETEKATEGAIEREEAASAEAIERQEQAFREGQAALQPYAQQEQAASTQLMAQMGLAPPAGGAGDGGGATMGTGGDAWGFGAAPTGGTQADRQNIANLVQDMLTQQQVIYKRAGYNGSNIHREAAQRTSDLLNQLKQSGQLPADFTLPSMTDLAAQAEQIEDSYGGHTKMAKNLYPGLTSDTFSMEDSVGGLLSKYDIQPPGGVNAGIMGPGRMLPGEKIPEGAMTGGETPSPGGGTGAQTAADIMARAGVEGLPPELAERYMADLMEDPRQDPELAAYLGLTDESLQVGSSYQDTPAYMAAREAGVEAVDASAAAGGGLYSGRRGEALRDVGQDVEQRYYSEAMGRRADMMGARRGERTGAIARRGAEYGAGRSREQSYYNNYMQMLAELSSPTTTTNIAQMGTDVGRDVSGGMLDTARNVGDLSIGGANARSAMYGDIAGGLGELAKSWI